MLRLGNQIRLTTAERDELSSALGFPFDPRTVAEHDDALRVAKAGYDRVIEEVPAELTSIGVDESGVAEARLMSAVLQNMLLDA